MSTSNVCAVSSSCAYQCPTSSSTSSYGSTSAAAVDVHSTTSPGAVLRAAPSPHSHLLHVVSAVRLRLRLLTVTYLSVTVGIDYIR